MVRVLVDVEQAYRVMAARDARFDGQFIVAVRTTGIYCRPSCPAITPRGPKRCNVEFYPTAAAAQQAGYRACRRCLPDAVPGSPEWNVRADLAGRAMRLISDGVVEREGVPGLARRVGYSARHLTRVLTAELGVGPLALARAHRAHSARLLIETAAVPFADVAFASGFATVRQFNDTIRAVFGLTPTELRMAARRRTEEAPATAGRLTLRLPYRPPIDAAGLLDFFAARSIGGVESVVDDEYARALRLPHGQGTARVRAVNGHVECTLVLADMRDLGSAVSRLRRLLDLDADPIAVDDVLSADPALAPLVAGRPGIRLPGSVDPAETLTRALIGQQMSVAAARSALEALTAGLGEPLATPDGLLTRLFPTPATIAEHGKEVLGGLRERVATVLAVNEALACGDIDLHVGADPDKLSVSLQRFAGVGPGTAGYVQMRVLGATDIFLASDAALRRGARALSLPSTVDALNRRARAWRPWRSYASMHLRRAAASTTRRQA
jgi:AraC family transcriptional regulator, regulatory protein of adaptative response / DNA-3-methyladenine glycosylase II